MCVYVHVGVFPEEYFDLSQPPDVGSPPQERAAWLASLPSTLREREGEMEVR